ncbi:uncharacterized protein si:zfos-741a10.3 isoform X1 [Rhinichthys klamathensis goyatoka]|uniref:uncharacterized protein si:zfos-741a10.3 isoform X1 n=1 Tax=Rhinichthys klamathensis goyatoka TaxID=3034132 RepID=UPI0024B49684|nr:uncharacterized protein si:zfos-741a10.3 isoform X1 [Rhinichthys klamathensis goyatoka]
MMLIFGLMLLLETAACVEVNCSFDQSGPCSAALGDKLRLKLVDASKYNLKIQKRNYNTQDDPVCKIKDDTMKECDLFNNRYDKVSVKNGILVINSVIRADSGNYRLQVFASDGTETSRDLQVIVEGVEFNCSFHQSVPCNAALGDKLRLKLVDASKYNLKIHKRNYDTPDDPVCKIKDDTMKECDLFNNRYDEVSVINGILIINSVIRADSGIYRLQVFASDGTDTSRDLQVIVEGTVTLSSDSLQSHVLKDLTYILYEGFYSCNTQ